MLLILSFVGNKPGFLFFFLISNGFVFEWLNAVAPTTVCGYVCILIESFFVTLSFAVHDNDPGKRERKKRKRSLWMVKKKCYAPHGHKVKRSNVQRSSKRAVCLCVPVSFEDVNMIFHYIIKLKECVHIYI